MIEQPIITSEGPATLVGGGPLGAEDFDLARRHAPMLVAVDGGADHFLRRGLVPEAVIGDLDSISDAARAAFQPRLHRIEEQLTTDFDKGLRHVAAPLILAIGFAGGRFDHELAVLNALLRHPGRPCIVIGSASLTFLAPPGIALDLAPGTALSLFPMGPVTVDSQGLVWPTNSLEFRPEGRIGTSNLVATAPVELIPEAPLMLVILPRDTLSAAIDGLSKAPRWG